MTALEPYRSGGIPAQQVYKSVFDLVTARDADYKLVPRLADSWTALNDTTWQFKLHPGVLFHNGDPLTAADVKFSPRMHLRPRREDDLGDELPTRSRG